MLLLLLLPCLMLCMLLQVF